MSLTAWLSSQSLMIAMSLAAALVLCWLIHIILHRWQRADQHQLRRLLVTTVRYPLLLLPWILCLFYFLHIVDPHEGDLWHDWLRILEVVVSVAFPLWILIRVTRSLPELSRQGYIRNLSYDLAASISRIVQIILVIFAVLALAQKLGYSLSALLTFGGVGGIVLGLAAKDWLANFFGGLMLMVDRPFKEGDWIKSPDRNIEGHVEHIGWRLTRIRTFERRPIYVPNSVFTSIVIETPSRMLNRRIVENFGLRYEDFDKVEAVMNSICEAFKQHTELNCKEPYYARFLKYGESALDCQIRVHVIPTGRVDFVRVQEQVMMIIADAVKAAGADFAYPVVRYLKES
ncbi:mechanosensitive ion channel protein MscS [Endozoicomonas sp. OPT23]|uniref:mechanosensitive ion channel family protein n=1 Tax=Endozoicomonas sp. OPT23 TaxID=2072845 RepID=UPI00129A4388|nr:mechanosensitive ion channel family protein [Endozoicomonas sp. OPT23]MRI34189.1 mechanosensitive ion channel protein MscS [Endozoicomonas sp. OPT23]